MDEIIPVKIQGVIIDPINRGFAVILKDDISSKWVPIYIGPLEAQSIALELEGQKPPRPGTHDLLKNILDGLKVTVEKVTITNLIDNTFYAIITITDKGIIKEIDSRPSDAIAVAIRVKAPIFISKIVLDSAGMDSMPHEDENSKALKRLQTKLNTSIENEDYEEAAAIRDEINKLKNRPIK